MACLLYVFFVESPPWLGSSSVLEAGLLVDMLIDLILVIVCGVLWKPARVGRSRIDLWYVEEVNVAMRRVNKDTRQDMCGFMKEETRDEWDDDGRQCNRGSKMMQCIRPALLFALNDSEGNCAVCSMREMQLSNPVLGFLNYYQPVSPGGVVAVREWNVGVRLWVQYRYLLSFSVIEFASSIETKKRNAMRFGSYAYK